MYLRAMIFMLMTSQMSYGFSTIDDPSTTEWIKTGSIGAAGIASTLGLFFVATPECHWCSTNDFDAGIYQAWIWKNRDDANLLSNVFAYGLAPALALGVAGYLANGWQRFVLNALVLLDSAAMTLALTELAKVTASRARPEAVYQYEGIDQSQANRSFLSGHTSLTFSLLSTASVMAFRQGHVWAPHFTALAAITGLVVGYARVAAGKHWMSDVLAGLGLGMAVGIAMPFIAYDAPDESKSKFSFRLAPTFYRPGAMLAFSW